jgi:hypothetical protein
MAITPSERQKAYRARLKANANSIAVNVFLDKEAHHALQELCQRTHENQATTISQALKRWLKQTTTTESIAPTNDADLKAFATTIQHLTNNMTTGLFGPKVFINHVWNDIHNPYHLSLSDFKQGLLNAHQKRWLTLAREDMPSQHDTDTIKASETRYMNAVYHYIRQTETR